MNLFIFTELLYSHRLLCFLHTSLGLKLVDDSQVLFLFNIYLSSKEASLSGNKYKTYRIDRTLKGTDADGSKQKGVFP